MIKAKRTTLAEIHLKIRILCCLLLLSALNINAQEGIQQRFFTSQNGLKISWVNNITKSPNNDLIIVHSPDFYFAKYDGFNFDYSINSSGILGKTYEDTFGNLWSLGEEDLDVANFYSNGGWQDMEFNAGIPFMPTPGMGNKLLFIRDGDLVEFDEAKQETRTIKQSEKSQIGQFIDMTTFQAGSVWVTGEEGIAKYLVQSDDVKEQWIDFKVPKELGLYHFKKPFEGENGELTLMSKSSSTKQNVLTGFDGKNWQKLYAFQTDKVCCGWRGNDHSLWIIKNSLPPLNGPIKDWSLFHIQQGKETDVIKNRILNRVLNDIVVEPNGTFWLATGSGLACFSPTLWRNQKANRDPNKRVKKIHEDLLGRLWFARENDFSLFSNNKWEVDQFYPAVFTGDICSLKSGLLVVGATDSGGLALYNPIDKNCSVKFPFGNEKIRYYDQDKNGNCFIILQNLDETSRLIRFDGEHMENLAEDLKINDLAPGKCEVTDVIQTSSGDIWIVTYTDIIVYKEGIRKSFDLKEAFEWGLSTSILELVNGKIWISGNKGILQYDGENWSLVQTPEFETARKMIISSDSSILVASGTGIHRLINGTWISNSQEEGLPDGVIFDILEDIQGGIWAATVSGVYCYFPEADIDAPETVIPSNVNFHDAIPSGEIQFIFEGYDKWEYTQADRLQYSYRFDENSWSSFKNNTIAKRVGLSAGSHIFEVRAMDRNGNIDPTPASWSFNVLNPWYRETYFIILLVIAVSLIILSIGFAITRHRQVEKLVITRTAQFEKTKEIAEESEQKFRTIYQSSKDAILLLNREGFFDCNAQALITFNVKNENEIAKLSPSDLSPLTQPDGSSSYDVSMQHIEKAFATGSDRFEWIHRRIKGELFPAEVLLTAFILKGEKVLQSNVRDISQQKQYEIELIKAKEKAEENDRLKSAFLANMSHEIRTPLNSIIGFSELLSDPFFESEQCTEFAQIIQDNGNNMLRIISDIMDISKIESGQIEIIKKTIAVNQLIPQIVKEFSLAAEGKNIDLIYSTSERAETVLINSDESRLKQVFSNLIFNAIKFTEKGFIEVGFTNDKDFIQFYVKDSGIGIPTNFQSNIFERFRQVETFHTRKHGGIGLGLAISKNLVEILGGKIWLESEEGKGSCFFFSLPIGI